MIPQVNGIWDINEETYHLPIRFHVKNTEFHEECMAAFCERTGTSYQSVNEKAEVTLIKNTQLEEEAYRIETKEDGIRIEASSEIGVIWALTSLYSLLIERESNEVHISTIELPQGIIEDAPLYEHRGLSFDCVRHFFEADEVMKIIEEIALVKMNVLHWHLSDDQGFRVESKKFPELHRQCAPHYYTQESIREIVRFAQNRGVSIIPEMDMPGHTTAILAAYPQYSCSEQKVSLGKSGGIYPIVLCPGKESTYHFVEELIDEVCDLFPSKWIHIGGDEAPDREWKSCPACQQKMAEEGLTQERQLQGYFSAKLIEMLKKRNRKAICWNDSLEASNFMNESSMNDETRIQFWSIQYADVMEKYLAAGGRFIYSDMFLLYMDYPSSMIPLEKIYRTKPVLRDVDYAGKKENLVGMECCIWAENLTSNQDLEEKLFPRLYGFAENVWGSATDYEGFEKRVEAKILSTKARGLHCLSLEESNPIGDKKKNEIMEYTSKLTSGMSEEMRALTLEFANPNEEFHKRFMKEFFGMDMEQSSELKAGV